MTHTAEQSKSHQYRYKFSFVMPVYNVEEYVGDTVESILSQTMNFEDNCEIIFVNDGSKDNVEAVCLDYEKRYPNNIKYIRQNNAGLSAARNRGLKEIEGKYVSFLDSDDKISPNTLELVYDFFEQHNEAIDFLSIPIFFFEGREGPHQLNSKFSSSRVINITEEPDSLQLSAASTFVRSEVFSKGWKFRSEIKRYAEDVNFLTKLVLEKMAYGVVSDARYYYRKRIKKGSILDGERLDRMWYLETPKLALMDILEYAKQATGTVPEYIQRVIMYDLQWRYSQADQSVLTKDEEREYVQMLDGLVVNVADTVIMSQENISSPLKFYILKRKYSNDKLDMIVHKNGFYEIDGKRIYNLKKDLPWVSVQLIDIKEDTISLYGYYDGALYGGSRLAIKVGANLYETTYQPERSDRARKFLGTIYTDNYPFRVDVPKKLDTQMSALVINGDATFDLPVKTHRNTGLDHGSGRAYRTAKNDGLIVRKIGVNLLVTEYSIIKNIYYELLYQMTLAKSRKFLGIVLRCAYFLFSIIYRKKNVWLISDRINSGRDNGEALFRYLHENPLDGVTSYFVIAKSSSDYQRMKQYGKVLNRNGLLYPFIFLRSSKVISSHADDFVINAFKGREHYLRDLFKFDFVFLQHGITKDDISSWLNRYNKDIKLFIAAAKPEYDSLLEPRYGYSVNDVKLTGFPRHDLLASRPDGRLVIAPTWRKSLAGEADQSTGIREYNSQFTSTGYYRFYQGLLSDARILSALKKADMRCEFYLHPSLVSQISDFKGSDIVTIKDMPYSYSEAFSNGDIMVTDYSSVAFDFAYLRKPVIYTQFDRETFFDGHLYSEGYFSYDDDGFGPVAYDYESAVKEIVLQIGNGHKMDKKYLQRADSFFMQQDTDNSKRVVEAIMDIHKRND